MYNCPYYTSVSELLASKVAPTLDGAVVSTSHSSHFDVGMSLLNAGLYRREMAEAECGNSKVHRAMNILMEKPMTADVGEAHRLWEISAQRYPEGEYCIDLFTIGALVSGLTKYGLVIMTGAFVINHTASYRPQTKVARHIIASCQLGKIRHISATMNGVR